MQIKIGISLGVACAALLAVLSGCGSAHESEVKPTAEELKQKAAVELAPKILAADETEQSLPAREDGSVSSEVVAAMDHLVFSDVIAIPDPGTGSPPLYLVWDEDALGVRITDAYFNLKKRDAYNRVYGDEERHNAFRDSETGRWFVPLLKIIGGRAENADPSQLHWVRLELHLQNGDQIDVKVGLRARGPVSPIRPEAVELEPLELSEASLVGERVLKKGFVLASEDYPNPTARPLALWVRGSAELKLETALSVPRFHRSRRVNDEGMIEVFETRQYERSQASMELRELRVIRDFSGSNEPVEEVLALDRWQKLVLGPYERIRLQWIAHLGQGTPRCSLPRDTVRTFKWKVNVCRKGPGLGSDGVTCREEWRKSSHRESWSLDGVSIVGSFARELRVAEPYLPDDEVIAEQPAEDRVVIIQEADESYLQRSGGASPAGARSFSCQGVF